MTGSATRWRRYGKDRLYVTAADGTRLGFRDLVTQQDHVDEPERATEFTSIVSAWLSAEFHSDTAEAARPVDVVSATLPQQREESATSVEETAAPQAAPEPVVEVPWEDLAQRAAGAMAREQAIALKQAAPVRTFVARVLGVHTEERAWRIGADGEEMVAAQLSKLSRKDPRWKFLHAIEIGDRGSDIDHLVVGPAGVFSLNAKHHPGAKVWVGGNTLLINGQRQPYIRNSRHEAQRASRLLTTACGFPVVVTGLVVPVGAGDITIKTPPDDVHVVNRMRLAAWLRNRPTVISDVHIETVFDAARRSTTWHPPR